MTKIYEEVGFIIIYDGARLWRKSKRLEDMKQPSLQTYPDCKSAREANRKGEVIWGEREGLDKDAPDPFRKP
jgi:hypothetical protein